MKGIAAQNNLIRLERSQQKLVLRDSEAVLEDHCLNQSAVMENDWETKTEQI